MSEPSSARDGAAPGVGGGPRFAFRPTVIAAMVTLLLTAGAVWLAFRWFNPTPPRTIVMTTGPEGGAYFEFGNRYKAILAREGIEVRLVPSAGAVENLTRLADPASEASVGFVQGGSAAGEEFPGVASLGTVFYEPIWLFHHGSAPSSLHALLSGTRISAGPEGSGSRAFARMLFRALDVDSDGIDLLKLPPNEACERLKSGEIGAAFISSAWESPAVQRLLRADDVTLIGFPRADAYVALFPFLSKLILPTGVVDLGKNVPPADVPLIAPKASLAVKQSLNPAIQYLLLEAAAEIHGKPGVFQKAGEFPAPESIDLPLSEHGRQYYKSGPPLLQRYLPFWMAVVVAQLLVLLIPVAAVLYPLLRLVPAVYAWGMRRRIFRLYGELRFIEADLRARGQGASVDDLVARLDRFEQRVHRMRIPTAFSQMLYLLKEHIGMVRRLLEAR